MHLSPTFLTKNTNFTTYKNSRLLWKNRDGDSLCNPHNHPQRR